MGSMASARRASICSVTTIVPSSAVLLAPTRPEIMSAVSSGATSRSVPKPAPQPSRPSAPHALHERCGLDDHDGAGEEGGDDDDGQRLDGHLVEVAFELGSVEARREEKRRAMMRPKSTPMPPTISAMPRNAAPVDAARLSRRCPWRARGPSGASTLLQAEPVEVRPSRTGGEVRRRAAPRRRADARRRGPSGTSRRVARGCDEQPGEEEGCQDGERPGGEETGAGRQRGRSRSRRSSTHDRERRRRRCRRASSTDDLDELQVAVLTRGFPGP